KAKKTDTVIRTSTVVVQQSEDSDSESEGELIGTLNGAVVKEKKKKEKVKVSAKLSSLVNLCQAVHFKGIDEILSTGKSYHMSSLSERKAEVLIDSNPFKFPKYTQKQLVRIYPHGTRVRSTNFNPVKFWNSGCQIVALNLQTPDEPTSINTAMFRLNGRSGYMLKPDYLLSKNVEPSEKRLFVKIISGQSLPFVSGEKNDIVDPYVSIEVHGHPEDEGKKKTRYVSNNGFNPSWNEDFTFHLKRSELDVIAFEVKDHDKRGFNDLIGAYYIWATAVSPGYRHIPLFDKSGREILAASIFVHIKFD
ncbi:hypothetical protein QYM36_003766, partial [Artemia franciscana]